MEKLETMHVEEKIFARIIKPVHEKVNDRVTSEENIMPKHLSSFLLKQLQKTKEQECIEAKRVEKIMELRLK